MSQSNQKEKGHFRRNWFFYTLLLLALSLAGYMWATKSMALNKQAAAFQTEKDSIVRTVTDSFNAYSARQLELSMKTLSWAVRGEIIRGNQEQVEQYFNQLVKVDKVEEAILINNSGTILIATDKKKEGSQFSAGYAGQVLKVDKITVIRQDGKQIAAAPIMSIDSHLGTLIVTFKKITFPFEPSNSADKNN